MEANFQRCLAATLKEEGKWSDEAHDPGAYLEVPAAWDNFGGPVGRRLHSLKACAR